MTKDEFLNKLQEALTDSVPPDTVRENIQFYSDYIDSEEKKGHSEEEVLNELGDPRLIAHTIKDTTPESASYQGDRYGSYYQDEESGSPFHSFEIDFGKWYWKVILFLIIFVVVFLLITVFSGFMALFMPVLPVIIMVGLMMFMFGGHR